MLQKQSSRFRFVATLQHLRRSPTLGFLRYAIVSQLYSDKVNIAYLREKFMSFAMCCLAPESTIKSELMPLQLAAMVALVVYARHTPTFLFMICTALLIHCKYTFHM